MPHLVLLGGFLGAGKTTILLQAADILQKRGLRVGMITNDQGDGLVDTASARLRGVLTEEVPQGCFCCRFDDLLRSSKRLTSSLTQAGSEETFVILAEPVGSCTDIAATVLRPMREMYSEQFSLAPLSIAVDATRLLQFVREDGLKAMVDDVTYLYAKQIEEADLLLLNKSDLISSADITFLRGWLRAYLPHLTVLPTSAQHGQGLDAWLDSALSENGNYGVATQSLDIDYKRYAQAEARLAWLNASGMLMGTAPEAKAQSWAETWLKNLVTRLEEAALSVAHMKLHIVPKENATQMAIKASVVGPNPSTITWDQRAPAMMAHGAEWILNARVDTAPDTLRMHVIETLVRMVDGVTPQIRTFECFQPAPPQPTHRSFLGR